jgi:hypothetical protein
LSSPANNRVGVQLAEHLVHAARVEVVNDRSVDTTSTPIVLYPNANRDGLPVAVLLERTGQAVTVVPAGEPWRTNPDGNSCLAHRLWITRSAVTHPR